MNIKRKLRNIRNDYNLGCMVILAILSIVLVAILLFLSKCLYLLIYSWSMSKPIAIGCVIFGWLLVIILFCTKEDKKMSKKDLVACLRSMNCTLPDFDIIKQTASSSMGWGPGGSNSLHHTFEVRFKKKGVCKSLDQKISLYKDLVASAPADISIEISVDKDSNTATIDYIESRDN